MFCERWSARRRHIDCYFQCRTFTCSPQLTLGLVTVSTFPENIFEQLESRQTDDRSATALAEWCRSMREDFQGLAVAETRVFGEPIRAQEIASERVELAVGVLRFFAPCHFRFRGTSRVARWGYAPQRTDRVFVTDGRIPDFPEQCVGKDRL